MATAYVEVQQYRPPSIECVLDAAKAYRAPTNVLLAIGEQEAGSMGAALRNANGSYDLGPAGINSIHLPELVQTGLSVSDAVHYLRYDGCYNYAMAAYLLGKQLSACKQEYWTCVANYHSKTPELNAVYRRKIIPLANKWADYLTQHYPVKESRP